jgi:hypothetical protein
MRLTVTKQELVADNVQAFGHREAAKKLRKAGVPFSIAYWLIFGVAPRKLPSWTHPVAKALLARWYEQYNVAYLARHAI